MLEIEEHGPVAKFRTGRSVLGRTFYHTAAYCVDGLLIDSGCAFTAAELEKALTSYRLEQIVNTHSHEDHIGANGPLQRARGVSILAHPLALPILANPRLQHLHFYRRFFWGWPEPSQGNPVGQWVETPQYRFQVIHTPGHSPDHIALYEPQQGWLFSGDTYIGGKDRAARPDYDVYALLASLRKLAALPLTRLFPGSGTVRTNPVSDIQCKIAHLEELAAEVRRLHDMGLDVAAIERKALQRELNITVLTLGHFRGSHLIRALLRNPEAPQTAPSSAVSCAGQEETAAERSLE